MANKTMTITLDTAPGEQTVFKIEFEAVNFMAVVDQVENVTIKNVHSQELFKVI